MLWRFEYKRGGTQTGWRESAATLSIIQSQLSAVWRHHYSRSPLIALYFIVETPCHNPLDVRRCLRFTRNLLPLRSRTHSLSLLLSLLCLALQFDKAYAYSIRHMFGKEGKRTDYTPYSCMKVILSNPPSQGDYHGESQRVRMLILNAIGPVFASLAKTVKYV